jgi:pimeloyl-ACP methyl ester carboxylesterase
MFGFFASSEKAYFADYEETRIRSCGVPVALSIWKTRSCSGKAAPCLVFHPGTMASPPVYGELMQRLRECGFTVIGVHHLSHGKSPRIKKVFSFQDLLQNGKDAVSYALERFGGPVVLMGHSQGGILSLAQAGKDERLAAVFPHCFLLPDLPEAVEVTRFGRCIRRRELFLRRLGRLAGLLPRLPVFIPMYLELKRIFAGSRKLLMDTSLKHVRLSYPLAYVFSLFNADLDYLRRPGNIRCPVFGLVARDDALFTPELLNGALRHVRAERKELILLSGGGHMAPFSSEGAGEIAAIARERCLELGLFPAGNA